MSRRKSDQVQQELASFDLAHLDRRDSGDAPSDNRLREAGAGLHSLIFRVVNFIVVCALGFICWGTDISRAQQTDFGVYARAVEFCRASVKRPMALDLDKRVLCFDGQILPGQDISLASSLTDGGLFVIRSIGGSSRDAMALADVLRDRHATVVVHDYCISACASFLLIASAQTFVLKGALVAWHNTTAPLCPSLKVAQDGGPKRFVKLLCSDSPPEYQRGWDEYVRREQQFLETRAVYPPLEWPPESLPIRRILRSMFEDTGREPYIVWTWHPRYYASSIKTKVFYEAYPESQAEVDALASKFGIPRILYDP